MGRHIVIHNHLARDDQPRDKDGQWTSTGGGVNGYHGASSAILASVRKNGLVPKNADQHVHITNSHNLASVYAGMNAGKHKPIVFEVKVPKTEFASFSKIGSAAGSTKPIPPSWIVGYRELDGKGNAGKLNKLS